MTFFSTIQTNFKGRDSLDDLAPCTAIVGDNRSGKTALITAFRLALKPRPAASSASRFFEYAPDGAKLLRSRLFGPFGEAEFTALRDAEGKAKAPVQKGPACTLVMEEQGEITSFGSERLQRAIVQRFYSQPVLVNDASLSADQRSFLRRFDPYATGLMEAYATVKADIRYARQQLGYFETELARIRPEDISGIEELPKLQRLLNLAELAHDLCAECRKRVPVELADLQRKVVAVSEAKQVQARRIEMNTRKLECLIQISQAEPLVGILERKRSEIVEESKAAVESEMNRFLTPLGYCVELSIDDSHCDFELRQGDHLRSKETMSGAERATLRLAAAMAWSRSPRFLLLDDEDIAPLSASSTLKLLSHLRCLVDVGEINQVLVATTRREEVPEGWLIVER